MCKRTGILMPAIFAAILSLAVQAAQANPEYPVGAETRWRFDLPAESLDKALRDIATQANGNSSYEPSVVVGLRAPTVKGELTVGSAMSRVL